MDVKLIFEMIVSGFVPGIAFQRPSAETIFPFSFILFRGVSMLFRSLQLVSKAAMNMNGIIFIRILSTYNDQAHLPQCSAAKLRAEWRALLNFTSSYPSIHREHSH